MFSALDVRLTKLYKGFIEVHDGSTSWKVYDENWDKVRRNMLCKHLGFEVNGNNELISLDIPSGEKIAKGDVMCYSTRSNETSCCTHLQSYTTTSSTSIPNVNCQICDKPIITGQNTFPKPTFSGNGTSDYTLARMDKRGWCSGNGDEYLEIDLQKEYNIFQIVVAADENQAKWSGSYSLKYSRNTSYENSIKITGNKNGYQAASTFVDIRNVRYIKIESTDKQEFCLRIELCEPSRYF
ncbi:uncharacterized protein LOC114537447 [Dendronephthya gigantea]|uniref:uncharacterized protein LOC114537447 n=1 Tax=Dendronephthya gigantea TaxID=151771 RepID=UPI0010696128|nr:uncharacterized protein LOC114537447 [Dendronephthya gigantea]